MAKAEKTFRDLYPGLSEEDLKEAKFNMTRDIELVLKIRERLSTEKKQADNDQLLS
jgi:hypothetical protein